MARNCRGIGWLQGDVNFPIDPSALDDGGGVVAHVFSMQWIKTTIGRLRVIGFWEGVSFLVLLLIAMPLKYIADQPQMVSVVGMAHGVLFCLYVCAAIQAALEHDWTWKRTLLVLIASCLPAGPFVVDARILKEYEKR